LLQGRTLRTQDDERAPRAAVVNQAFAKQFVPMRTPSANASALKPAAPIKLRSSGFPPTPNTRVAR
jgi:hypothetical protein